MSYYIGHISLAKWTPLPFPANNERANRCGICGESMTPEDYAAGAVADVHWFKCGELNFITPAHPRCLDGYVDEAELGERAAAL